MPDINSIIDSCLKEIDKARSFLKKSKTAQVRSIDEIDVLKSTALAWFNNHRKDIIQVIPANSVSTIDSTYQEILAYCDKHTMRAKYDSALKKQKENVSTLRTASIVQIVSPKNAQFENPPDFSNLVSDTEMQDILKSRWEECQKCVIAKAPLAAIVMMGGLLETLLLSRINQLTDQSPVFKANSAPKDKSGKTLPLREWGLKNYIDIAHELKWITQTVKDLGEVLRDYRNYIHPFKQRSNRTTLMPDDSIIMWQLCKSISSQIIGSLP